jgi:hypothetical protein
VNVSDDGERVAFLARNNALYRDGKLYREYGSRQVSFPVTMSSDGAVLAWKLSAEKDSGFSIVVNGVEGPVYANTGLPVLSADGSVVAYRATGPDASWFVIVNGRRVGGSFELVTDPAISREGRVIAYAAEADKNLLFVGEKTIELSKHPSAVFLSPDGKSWGYVTRSAMVTQSIVVTERGSSEPFDEIRGPEFSPDGRIVAFGGRQGNNWFIVVGERMVPAPGLVGDPMWSADGKTLGYGALLGRELWWKVIPVG